MEPLTWTKKDCQNDAIACGSGLFNLPSPVISAPLFRLSRHHPNNLEGIHPVSKLFVPSKGLHRTTKIKLGLSEDIYPSSIFLSWIPVAAFFSVQ